MHSISRMQYLNADCIESFWDAQPILRPTIGISADFASLQDIIDHMTVIIDHLFQACRSYVERLISLNCFLNEHYTA